MGLFERVENKKESAMPGTAGWCCIPSTRPRKTPSMQEMKKKRFMSEGSPTGSECQADTDFGLLKPIGFP